MSMSMFAGSTIGAGARAVAGPSTLVRGGGRQLRSQAQAPGSKQSRTYATPPSAGSRARRSAPIQPQTQAPGQQKIGDVFTKKSFGDAWRGLTPIQRMSFFAFVGIGGATEYWLLKSYILDPIKARRAEEEKTKLEKDLGAAGGADREVLLDASLFERVN